MLKSYFKCISCEYSSTYLNVCNNKHRVTNYLGVLFVSGIAFAIPSTISKVGLTVRGNQGFFLSVNTFVLFLGTAIAPILSIVLNTISSFTVQFNIIAVIGIIAIMIALCMPRRKYELRGNQFLIKFSELGYNIIRGDISG